MNKWKKELGFVLMILIIAVLTACGNVDGESNSDQTEAASEESGKELTIGQINWAENIAVTNMWKVILEEKGYDVKLNVLNMGTTMKALETGDIDASLEIWLPVLDANYLEEYQDTVNFSDATWLTMLKSGLLFQPTLKKLIALKT